MEWEWGDDGSKSGLIPPPVPKTELGLRLVSLWPSWDGILDRRERNWGSLELRLVLWKWDICDGNCNEMGR